MKLADKVQKIREEVEKLKSQLIRGACASQIAMETRCKEEAYNEVLAILDTTQEEPVSKDYRERYRRIAESEEFRKNHDGMSIGDIVPVEEQEPASEELEKVVEEIVDPTVLNAYGTKEIAKRLRNTICGTSVSDGLEEASKNYALNNTPWDDCKDEIQESFKAGAQWQKEKNESTTEDLGEYINELSKQFPEVSFAKLSRIAVRVVKWQKQQMMAKAIDGDITFDYYGEDDKTYGCIAHDSFCLEDFGLKDRDKVKMILIKENRL